MYKGIDRRKSVEEGTRDIAVTAMNKIDYHMDECARRYQSIQKWMIALVVMGGAQILNSVLSYFHK